MVPSSTDNDHAPMTGSTLAEWIIANILNINEGAFTNMALRSVKTTIPDAIGVPLLGASSDTAQIAGVEVSVTTKEEAATA